MTTRKDLEAATTQLNVALGKPAKGIGSIVLDYASCYGGYALREEQEHGGQAFFWPRWSRVSAHDMDVFFAGFFEALERIRRT